MNPQCSICKASRERYFFQCGMCGKTACHMCSNETTDQCPHITCTACLVKSGIPQKKIVTADATVTLYGNHATEVPLYAGGQGREAGDVLSAGEILGLMFAAALLIGAVLVLIAYFSGAQK